MLTLADNGVGGDGGGVCVCVCVCVGGDWAGGRVESVLSRLLLGMYRWPLRAHVPLHYFLCLMKDPMLVTFIEHVNYANPNSVTLPPLSSFFLC